MNWGHFLFSFRGRINRAKYWLFVLLSLIASAAFIGVAFAGGPSVPIFVLVGIAYVVLLYVGLAVGAKRLHDRDRTAWWLVVFYLGPSLLEAAGRISQNHLLALVFSVAAVAVVIWAFVELGWLRGTPGINSYGPDPLGSAAVTA